MKVSYKKSSEKWLGLEKVAREVLKDERLAELCHDVYRKIMERGDAEADCEFKMYIKDVIDFSRAILHSEDMPCIHCLKYAYCGDCPLSDDGEYCCDEWFRVRGYLCEKYIVCF